MEVIQYNTVTIKKGHDQLGHPQIIPTVQNSEAAGKQKLFRRKCMKQLPNEQINSEPSVIDKVPSVVVCDGWMDKEIG